MVLKRILFFVALVGLVFVAIVVGLVTVVCDMLCDGLKFLVRTFDV